MPVDICSLYIQTPLWWILASKHQAMKPLPYWSSGNKCSCTKVHWFRPLNKRKNSHGEQSALHFSISSHCSKERPRPFQLWGDSAPHKELPYIQVLQNMPCSLNTKKIKFLRNLSGSVISYAKKPYFIMFNKMFAKYVIPLNIIGFFFSFWTS